MTITYMGWTPTKANADLDALWALGRGYGAMANVKDPLYGARGDGIHNDSLAIQAASDAVNAAGGGVVFFPPGVFRCETRISPVGYANVTWVGCGPATILRASGDRTSLFSSFPEPAARPVGYPSLVWQASRLAWYDLTFDMDYDVNADGGVANPTYAPYSYGADNYQYPIYAYFVNGVTVQRCEFRNAWFNGVETYGSDSVDVSHNRFLHVADKANYLGYYSCVETDGGQNLNVSDNTALSCGNFFNANGDNSLVNPSGVVGVSRLIIARNIGDLFVSQGIAMQDHVFDVLIEGNILPATTNGIAVTFPQIANANAIGPRRIKIKNNLIPAYNVNAIPGATGIDVQGDGIEVSGNTVANAIASGTLGNFYGVIVRQAVERVTGSSVDRNGGCDVSHNTARGSFRDGYGIAVVQNYAIVTYNGVHDESGQGNLVTSTGANSPAVVGTLSLP